MGRGARSLNDPFCTPTLRDPFAREPFISGFGRLAAAVGTKAIERDLVSGHRRVQDPQDPPAGSPSRTRRTRFTVSSEA